MKPKKFNSSIVDFNHQFKRAATVVQLKKIKKKHKKASHKSRKRGYAFSSEEEPAGSSSSYGLEEYAHEEGTQEVEDDEDFFEMREPGRPKPIKRVQARREAPQEDEEGYNFGDDFEDALRHGNDDLVGGSDHSEVGEDAFQTPSDIIKSIKQASRRQEQLKMRQLRNPVEVSTASNHQSFSISKPNLAKPLLKQKHGSLIQIKLPVPSAQQQATSFNI